MAKSPFETMIMRADMQCAVCDTSQSVGCDCWTKCALPGCQWSYLKGTSCRNPAHKSALVPPLTGEG